MSQNVQNMVRLIARNSVVSRLINSSIKVDIE